MNSKETDIAINAVIICSLVCSSVINSKNFFDSFLATSPGDFFYLLCDTWDGTFTVDEKGQPWGL